MVIQKLFLQRITKFARVAVTVMLSVAMTGMSGPWMSKTTASDWMPMLPDQDFYDFQLFAPPDLGSYNMYERDDDGIYFNYDKLYWGITVPRTVRTAETTTGEPIIPSQPVSPFTIVDLNNDFLEYSQDNPIELTTITATGGGTSANIPNVAQNFTLFEIGNDPLRLDLNTSWMRTKMVMGNRYEGGWSYGGRGVHLSYFQLGKQEQSFGSVNEFAANSPTTETTFTPPTGNNNTGGLTGGGAQLNTLTIDTLVESGPPDHLITQDLLQRNSTQIQSASVALTLKKRLGRRKGSTQVRYSLGPRFVQVADRYEIDYASYQNSFNTLGGSQQGGGGTGGNNTGGNNTTGNNTGGGGTGGGGTGGNNTGATAGGGGNNTNTTGAGGDTQTTFSSGNTGGGGLVGITVGALPSTLTGVGAGSLFQTADWETFTSNNMVGPEFGLNFEGKQGAWEWYAGGTFTAAFNWQNNIYKGANLPQQLGADYLRANFSGGGLTSVAFGEGDVGSGTASTVSVPPTPLIQQIFATGQSNATNSAEHRFSFSPIGEWRFGGRYRISQGISLNFGYTGMWLSQIARASTNTKFVRVVKQQPFATRNLTATIDTPGGGNPGFTAIVDGTGRLATQFGNQGYVPNGTTPPIGFEAVPPVIQVTDASGTSVDVRNPQQFVADQNVAYTQQQALDGGQEYVLTNGIDFGLEIKF